MRRSNLFAELRDALVTCPACHGEGRVAHRTAEGDPRDVYWTGCRMCSTEGVVLAAGIRYEPTREGWDEIRRPA